MRLDPIPLYARQGAITLALQSGDREMAQQLRADLYKELLEFIANAEPSPDGWMSSVSLFLTTENLGF